MLEDIAQQAFIELMRYNPRAIAHGSLAGLVARIALHRAMDHLRRGERRPVQQMSEDLVYPDTAGEDEIAVLLRTEVEQLSDSYRLPVLLHYYQQLSTEETALALGISPSAVRTRLSRAVTRLRKQVQQRGYAIALPLVLSRLTQPRHSALPATLPARLQLLASTAAISVSNLPGPLLFSMATVKLVTAVLVIGTWWWAVFSCKSPHPPGRAAPRAPAPRFRPLHSRRLPPDRCR